MTRTITTLLVLCSLSLAVAGQVGAGDSLLDSDYFVGKWRYSLNEVFEFVFTITDAGVVDWQRTEPDPGLPPLDYGGTVAIKFFTSRSGGYYRGFTHWLYDGEALVHGQGLFERTTPDEDGTDRIKLTLYLESNIYLVGSAGTWTTIILTRDQPHEGT